MLPTIESASTAAVGAVQQSLAQTRRPEVDAALDAYYAQSIAAEVGKPRPAQADSPMPIPGQKPDSAGEAQRLAPAARTGAGGRSKTEQYFRAGQDQAEINFQFTREERDVFTNAMSGLEKPEEMSEEEQAALQAASQRIEKMIDDALTRSTDRGDRLDKAIKEWYTRLTNGKHKAPLDLINLIRQAAAGNVNFTPQAEALV